MAQQIRWNNVDAPNLNGVASMQNQAMQMMQRGADSLMGIFENLNATDAANAQLQGQRNTEDALSQIMGLDIAGLKELQSSGGLNADTLRKKYGNQTDIMKILGFADGREGELQDRAVKGQKFDDMNAEVADRPNMSEFYKARAAGDVNGMIKAAENIQFYQNQANASGAIEDRRDKNFAQSMQKANLGIAQAGLAMRQKEFNLKAEAAKAEQAKAANMQKLLNLGYGDKATSPEAQAFLQEAISAKVDGNAAKLQKLYSTIIDPSMDKKGFEKFNEYLDNATKLGKGQEAIINTKIAAAESGLSAEKAQLQDRYLQQLESQTPGASIILKAKTDMKLEDAIKDVKSSFDGRGITYDEGDWRKIIVKLKNSGGNNVNYGEISEALKLNTGSSSHWWTSQEDDIAFDSAKKALNNVVNLKTSDKTELDNLRNSYRVWDTKLNNTFNMATNQYRKDLTTMYALGGTDSEQDGSAVKPITSLSANNPDLMSVLTPTMPNKMKEVERKLGTTLRQFNRVDDKK